MKLHHLRQMIGPLIVGVAYYWGARLGFSLSFEPDYIAALWPPNAIVLTALLLTSQRQWWAYLLAIVPAELANDLPAGFTWLVALGFAGANCLEVLVAAMALRRIRVGYPRFNNLKQVILFIVYAVLLAPFLSASVAAALSAWGTPSISYWLSWQRWFLGDSLAHLTLTPALLLWVIQGKSLLVDKSVPRLVEAAGLALGLGIAAHFVFWRDPGTTGNLSVFFNLLFPFLLWAAVRFGPVGASTANFAVALISIWYTGHGRGPFATLSPAENVLSVQAYLVLTAIPVILLATLIEERNQVQRKLRHSYENLELKVAQRTGELALANQELDRQVQKLKTLFDVLPVGVSILDQNQQVTEMNAALERILDISKTALLANKHKNRKYIRHDGTPMLPAEFPSARALAEEQAIYDVEIGVVKEDGTIIWTSVNAAPLPPPEEGIVIITSDLTERKKVQVELQRAKEIAESASRAKSDFLAHMSHELRTPLNAILGYAQIFKRDRSLNARQQQGIDVIYEGGEHLLGMINEILDLAKIEAGRIELRPTHFHLANFLQILVEIIRIRAEQKGLMFTYELDPILPTQVFVDEQRLRQVLLNLLSNGVKFTETGQVSFKVSLLDPLEGTIRRVRFQVTDTGRGIASDQLEEIFSPFYQVSDHFRAEGTGLGLTITRRLVQLLGGELQVRSQVGQGSSFWFDLALPLTEGEPSPGETIYSRQIVGFTGEPVKILIVDDHLENRVILRDFLESLGFTVSEAGDGQEALAQVREVLPNFILMDLVMPSIDGFEATRRIRQMAGLNGIVLVGVSATIGEDIRQRYLAVGGNDFLPKPVQFQELLTCLETHLGLEWQYEPVSEREFSTEGLSNIIPPPPEDLLALRTLAYVGSITELEQYLATIGRADKIYLPFVSQMNRLLDQFNFARIIDLLTGYLEGGE